MVDQDDWRLGDEPEPVACPSCGKRNRAGQPRCVICGSPLGDVPADEPPLRTIGEAMGGGRGGRRRRERWWLWPLAATALLAVVGAAVWQLMPHEPAPEIADLPTVIPPLATRALPTPRLGATPRPERTLPPPPLAPPPVVELEPAATAAPVRVRPTMAVFPPAGTPPPASVRTAIPPIAPTGVPRVATPHLSPAPPPARPAVPAAEDANDDEEAPRVPDGDEPPIAPPEEEDSDAPDAPDADSDRDRPALGTDLRDATRAYRAAIDVHNERVDAYNAVADELQRHDLDDPEVPALERDLGRARADVERARVVAEEMRTRMESVRARYR